MLTRVYYSDIDELLCPIGIEILDSKGKIHEISFSSLSFDDNSSYETSTIRNHELAYFHSDNLDWHSHVYGDFKLESVHVTEQEFSLIKSYWQVFKEQLNELKKVKWTGKCISIDCTGLGGTCYVYS